MKSFHLCFTSLLRWDVFTDFNSRHTAEHKQAIRFQAMCEFISENWSLCLDQMPGTYWCVSSLWLRRFNPCKASQKIQCEAPPSWGVSRIITYRCIRSLCIYYNMSLMHQHGMDGMLPNWFGFDSHIHLIKSICEGEAKIIIQEDNPSENPIRADQSDLLLPA